MRLSPMTLPTLPAPVARPAYRLADARIGIVHLGLGAFHRAHQAVYVDDRLAAGELDWAIAGVSLRSPEPRDALAPQDGLYTVLVQSAADSRARVIGAVREALVATEGPARVLDRMTAPEVRIVSLTITEKGYCHDPATGALRGDHPDILADRAAPAAPRSAPGFLVEALRRRRAAGIPPFAVMCCDNLPGNGAMLRGIVTAFAALDDPDLARWIEDEVPFPSTMVDRIVPATTEEDRRAVAALLGVEDRLPVVTEPFSQWVIEDRFPLGRPAFDAAGAEFVADVAPYETMKLRLLNGPHSLLAYLGFLAGFDTIAAAVGDPRLAAAARAFMAEAVTTVRAPRVDLAAYQAEVLARFANPALRHRTAQVAMDGSQKLPQRMVGSIRDRLKSGLSIGSLALGVAAWMRHACGVDERGDPIEIRDPLAARFARIVAAEGLSAKRLTPAFLGIREIFGNDIGADPRLRAAVEPRLASLIERGAIATVASPGAFEAG